MTGAFPTEQIGALVKRATTWNPAREAMGQTIRYVDLGAIDNDAKAIVAPQTIKAAESPSRARQLLRRGDVLVSTVRPNLNGVARVPAELDGATGSTGFCVLRANENLDPNYLFQWVRAPAFVAALVARASGQSYPAVSDRIVLESEIPLPPIDEQRRVAQILDLADLLRKTARGRLGRIECLYSALFAEMFGDWSLPGESKRLTRIGDRLDFLTSGSRGWAEYYRDTGSAFLRIQNVRMDRLDMRDLAHVSPPDTAEAKRTRVQPGDVLLSITADLGRTGVVPEDLGEAFINQHLAILRSSAFAPRYLSAALASPAGQKGILRRNREGVKAGLNFDDVRSLEIPDVDLDEQLMFAERASVIDEIRLKTEEQIARLSDLFASLQHRAFCGEL